MEEEGGMEVLEETELLDWSEEGDGGGGAARIVYPQYRDDGWMD